MMARIKKKKIGIGAGFVVMASFVLWVSPSKMPFAETPARLYTVLANYVVHEASEWRGLRLEPDGVGFLVSECERRSEKWADVGFSKAEAVWNCSKLVGTTLDHAAIGGGPYTVSTLKSALPSIVNTISLKIVTEPLGARVWMHGALVGETPIESVNIKTHIAIDFLFRKSGFREKAVRFVANDFEPMQLLFVYLE